MGWRVNMLKYRQKQGQVNGDEKGQWFLELGG